MISTTTLKTVSPRRGVGKGTKMTDLERAGRQGDSSVGMPLENRNRGHFSPRGRPFPAKYKQKWRRKYVAISFKFFLRFFPPRNAIDFCEYETYY